MSPLVFNGVDQVRCNIESLLPCLRVSWPILRLSQLTLVCWPIYHLFLLPDSSSMFHINDHSEFSSLSFPLVFFVAKFSLETTSMRLEPAAYEVPEMLHLFSVIHVFGNVAMASLYFAYCLHQPLMSTGISEEITPPCHLQQWLLPK